MLGLEFTLIGLRAYIYIYGHRVTRTLNPLHRVSREKGMLASLFRGRFCFMKA